MQRCHIIARNVKDQVHCALMISKTRLVPIRAITIPRLELAAATLAIQLDRLLEKEIELPIRRSTFWTDSTTAIQYLRNNSKRFRIYVANRSEPIPILNSGGIFLQRITQPMKRRGVLRYPPSWKTVNGKMIQSFYESRNNNGPKHQLSTIHHLQTPKSNKPSPYFPYQTT